MWLLKRSAKAWSGTSFNQVLKVELEQAGFDYLPLQKGLSASSYALPEPLQVMVINATEDSGIISAKVGIFFQGMIAGCNCADDPSPIDTNNEYCEVRVEIDLLTSEATAALI